MKEPSEEMQRYFVQKRTKFLSTLVRIQDRERSSSFYSVVSLAVHLLLSMPHSSKDPNKPASPLI